MTKELTKYTRGELMLIFYLLFVFTDENQRHRHPSESDWQKHL